MSVPIRFRDRIPVPFWLSDRNKSGPGLNVGWRFLWCLIAILDLGSEMLMQGIKAWFPGIGTDSAIPYIEKTRGLLRGQTESIASFQARLIQWLDIWPKAAHQKLLAQILHGYLGNNPRVRIVNRAGHWWTVNEDGTTEERLGISFNWDSVSHPERAGFWSEMWIIVYPTQWAHRTQTFGSGFQFGGDQFGLGHYVSRQEYDAVKSLLSTWKALHSKIRAVIWTSDPDRFDPDTPASLPDGEWGAWGTTGGAGTSRIASHRDMTTCRYWEPR